MLGDEIERTEGHRADPRIKRIVMLAPPNNGAKLAQLLADNKLFKSIAGPTGAELGPHWAELEKHLAIPTCEFGIIAGGRDEAHSDGKGDEHGRNPLLQGDDDLIVAVPETKLPGASDFLVLPALHAFMMDEPKVQEATLSFLLHGYFESADRRHPLGKGHRGLASFHLGIIRRFTQINADSSRFLICENLRNLRIKTILTESFLG